MAVRDDRGDVKQTTAGFRDPRHHICQKQIPIPNVLPNLIEPEIRGYVTMNKLLGLVLGMTMIALTPAIGNAAEMIKVNCSKFAGASNVSFLLEKVNKRQKIPVGDILDKVAIRWEQKFMLADFGGGDIVKFDYLSGVAKLTKNGKSSKIIGNCKFKNLGSVEQRLQALEERMDRLESKDFTELDQAMDQEFLKFLKSKADLWKKAGECLTNEVTSIPKQVKEVTLECEGDINICYEKVSSGNKKKWKKILGKCGGLN